MKNIIVEALVDGAVFVKANQPSELESVMIKKGKAVSFNEDQATAYHHSLKNLEISGLIKISEGKAKKVEAPKADLAPTDSDDKTENNDSAPTENSEQEDKQALVEAKKILIKELQIKYENAKTKEEKKTLKEEILSLKKEIHALK